MLGSRGPGMDPITVKLILVVVAAIVGAILALAGIALFWRGATGSSDAQASALGVTFKLSRVGPGAVVGLLGVVLVVVALSKAPTLKVEEQQRDAGPSASILETWLKNAAAIKGNETYGQVIDAIVGPGTKVAFQFDHVIPTEPTSLGALAAAEYGDARYWRLLAAINKDRGYYDYRAASADTAIAANSLIEVWRVSRFYGVERKSTLTVAGPAIKAGYDEMLGLVEQGKRFPDDISFDALDDRFRKEQLSLALSPADTSGGADTLGELSLKYYGDKKYWKLIAWANRDKLPATADAKTLVTDHELRVLLLFP